MNLYACPRQCSPPRPTSSPCHMSYNPYSHHGSFPNRIKNVNYELDLIDFHSLAGRSHSYLKNEDDMIEHALEDIL